MDIAIRLIEYLLFILVIYKLIFEKDKEKSFYWYAGGNILLYPLMKLPIIPAAPVLLPLICIIRAYKDDELKKLWQIYPLRILTLVNSIIGSPLFKVVSAHDKTCRLHF